MGHFALYKIKHLTERHLCAKLHMSDRLACDYLARFLKSAPFRHLTVHCGKSRVPSPAPNRPIFFRLDAPPRLGRRENRAQQNRLMKKFLALPNRLMKKFSVFLEKPVESAD
jgi:hypothetical protein